MNVINKEQHIITKLKSQKEQNPKEKKRFKKKMADNFSDILQQ